ncbi:alpha/beta fold hydrolase [Actinacidiphila sp. DG2A-62]|uniref:alpha/beta fold hydrolase n=1 Tax=Actinacidiphila sp. DG2A-62 TaxID=3108821 RepID=UPI002DB6D1AD|nr:alpha/beta fold hydrolase [Actinacidiphila sp. DG2A-62]MEC3993863.1 alpha/beta fold hydrolase [Actinacidiphila sp. DG2A-62]
MTPGHQLAHDIKGTGPLLVAVHGITENRGFWDPVRLHQHFRVPRVDLRGHGESPRISPFGIDASVEDIHRLIESLSEDLTGDQSPPVVGHSLGGVIATAYAARYPTPGVVTIDQSLRVGPLPTRMCSAAFGPRCSIPHLAEPEWFVSRVREFFGG